MVFIEKEPGISLLTFAQFLFYLCYCISKAVAQWLMCSAINLKVAGSIPDDVIGIFH